MFVYRHRINLHAKERAINKPKNSGRKKKSIQQRYQLNNVNAFKQSAKRAKGKYLN